MPRGPDPADWNKAVRAYRISQAMERSPLGFMALVADGADEFDAACQIMAGEPLVFGYDEMDTTHGR